MPACPLLVSRFAMVFRAANYKFSSALMLLCRDPYSRRRNFIRPLSV
jgi:hypothetical protein